MEKNALVIGGTGFLGAGIVDALRQAGWSVTNLARGQMPSQTGAVPLIKADRSQDGAIAAAVAGKTFDLVVDCAAYAKRDAEDAVEAFAGKVGHFIFISTDFVYGADPAARYPLAEEAKKQREVPYSAGKLDCEEVFARAFAERAFPVTTLRPPHILGAGKALGCDPLAQREMRLPEIIAKGEPLRLLNEGMLLIQPVWNREVGTCIAHIAGNPRTLGQTYNCAGGECVTTRRYYQIIADRLSVELNFESVSLGYFVKEFPGKAHLCRHRAYDMQALWEATGFVPQSSLEEAISETLQWVMRKN